ncbi:enolase C-terminal domain-like protein [Jannaschia sp. LMIT008]|uniref:enolase C-terminal domain-like protein n=1 Tax=Jannaschia maritima TaxID=3032585 RepID=UPI002811C54D|nr:enolase C-terminal domain-like protein [Jannaschia sp. LMIT008]
MTDHALRPARIDVVALSAPLDVPRRNAFGTMHARPALLVRMVDRDGAEGWGEAFCNWPAFGSAHRARILSDVLAPLATGRRFDGPEGLWRDLTDRTRPLVLQCGEAGPFAQCIAALDVAGWGVVADRTGRDLAALWGTQAAPVPAYASALTADRLDAVVPTLRARGWTGWKLKVGFGRDADLAALGRLRDLVGPDDTVMADANQAWTVDDACRHADAFAPHRVAWLEEPIPADAPAADWAALARRSSMPLAAGENVRGEAGFATLMGAGVRVVQPDVAKWGGLSGLRRIAAAARGAGAVLAPHFLGSSIGLAATAEACRALGAAWIEVDATPNPLRTELGPAWDRNGWTPDPTALGRFAAP